MAELVLKVEGQDHLIAHIEGLQAALTRRNEKIAELSDRLEREPDSDEINKIKAEAYRRGWKDAAGRLMESTRETALLLHGLRKDAFETYLEGERL